MQPSCGDQGSSGHKLRPGSGGCEDHKVSHDDVCVMRNDMRANIYRSEYLSEGYTMTREDGWFDFMVNGGGAVTLQFGKSPFPPKIETLFAPWNEVSAGSV